MRHLIRTFHRRSRYLTPLLTKELQFYAFVAISKSAQLPQKQSFARGGGDLLPGRNQITLVLEKKEVKNVMWMQFAWGWLCVKDSDGCDCYEESTDVIA